MKRVIGVLSILILATATAHAGPVYFVVAEPAGQVHNGDSFVLALEDPLDIAHARDLIARGPQVAGASIVFAEIVAGSDGINRDVLAAGEPLWSWHVSKFEGFGDIGIELTDGWPSFVEQDVASWIANTSSNQSDPNEPGHIGFWSYPVVAELGTAGGGAAPPAVPLPAAVYAGGLTLVAVLGRQLLGGRSAFPKH